MALHLKLLSSSLISILCSDVVVWVLWTDDDEQIDQIYYFKTTEIRGVTKPFLVMMVRGLCGFTLGGRYLVQILESISQTLNYVIVHTFNCKNFQLYSG